VVARDVGAGAAKDQVAAVRSLGRQNEIEQIRTAADDVVLTATAEDHVVAAVAFDVVVTVARTLESRPDDQIAGSHCQVACRTAARPVTECAESGETGRQLVATAVGQRE